jgi:hypothetical protein
MAFAADDPRLIFKPEAEINRPILGPAGAWAERFVDHWWIVHPEKGLAFWGTITLTPQANANEAVTRRLAKQYYPWAEVRQIPLVVIDRRSGRTFG